MKFKSQIILLFLLSFAVVGFSQRCNTERETLRAIDTEYDYAKGLEEFDSLAVAFENDLLSTAERGDTLAFIPVVVHVVYRLNSQNISYDQIKSQIDVLNRDFKWDGDFKDKIPEVFRKVGLASGIQFRLADRDPFGNFTNGVTRTQTDVENIGSEAIYHRTSKGGIDPWPQPHYLNIWVCELEGNALGFAILPSNNMSERDGIVMSPKAFGTMGSAISPYNGGRTLVHEVGHYLGLRHPWGKGDGGGCQSTDHMSDTPKQDQENFGCEDFPHFSCGGQPNGDMFMNFMDYGNDTCMLLFTEQQVQFMRLVLRRNRATLFHSDGFTGLEERSEPEFRIYPNPGGQVLHIETSTRGNQITISSITGEIVEEISSSGLISVIDISDLSPGVYLVQTKGKTQKLLVQ